MVYMKTLVIATAASVGLMFAAPVASQAMPLSAPDTRVTENGNIIQVHKKKWRHSHKKWRKNKWARYDDRRRHRHYRHRRHHHGWYDPYYYDDYYDPYYYGGYGGYGPGYYGPGFFPGIGLQFRID